MTLAISTDQSQVVIAIVRYDLTHVLTLADPQLERNIKRLVVAHGREFARQERLEGSIGALAMGLIKQNKSLPWQAPQQRVKETKL